MRAELLYARFEGDDPTSCEASIPAPTPEHRERIRRVIARAGCFIVAERERWIFQGAWLKLYPLLKRLDAVQPWWGSGDVWGMVASIAVGTRAIAQGTQVWVLRGGAGRTLIHTRFWSGRSARVWIDPERLNEWRVGWLPPERRSRGYGWDTKEAAQAALDKQLGEHVVGARRPPRGPARLRSRSSAARAT